MPGVERSICSEVIELRLHGTRAKAPASIVEPLLISDLPVFLRWRGEPPWGSPELEQLVDLTDRLIVDSTEWDDLPYPYRHLVQLFDRTAVSDIAWARTSRWRTLLASLWPGIADVRDDPRARHAAQAQLLAGWLRSRLGARHRARARRAPSASRASSSTASRRRSRRAIRRCRATCCRTSSTASPATASTRTRCARRSSKGIGALVRRTAWMIDRARSALRARLPEFRRVAAAIAGDRELGCDAVQEAFAKAVREAPHASAAAARSKRGCGGSSSTRRATRGGGGRVLAEPPDNGANGARAACCRSSS